eukprot:gnl/MRDRNA2_/MRDRNA2_126136_c0_seq1.p1 gnl/MRDRNA2_/MRDRNA2_126136_c0~~gnl/MRDRNA2_/MRDRNA2_126136_c0_seq1.p1  ORF type:complete len:379 (+),score=59.18 gnl/MRDRNA2_/MRDRNA2_126136_c0_seq1:211-1347(+)
MVAYKALSQLQKPGPVLDCVHVSGRVICLECWHPTILLAEHHWGTTECVKCTSKQLVVCITKTRIVTLSAQSGVQIFQNDTIFAPQQGMGVFEGMIGQSVTFSHDMLFIAFEQLYHFREERADGQEVNGYGGDWSLYPVVAMNLLTGSEVWRDDWSQACDAVLLAYSEQSRILLVGSTRSCSEAAGECIAYDASTGDKLFSQELNSRVDSVEVFENFFAMVLDASDWGTLSELGQDEQRKGFKIVVRKAEAEVFQMGSKDEVMDVSSLDDNLIAWVTSKGCVILMDVSRGVKLSEVNLMTEGVRSIQMLPPVQSRDVRPWDIDDVNLWLDVTLQMLQHSRDKAEMLQARWALAKDDMLGECQRFLRERLTQHFGVTLV